MWRAKMGLPVERLVIATNVNDILVRSLHSGRYEVAGVTPTMSPSMDIQVSSNFERLLFDLYDRDGKAIAGLMSDLARSGVFEIDRGRLAARSRPVPGGLGKRGRDPGDHGRHLPVHGVEIDPHTAVGIAAGRRERPEASVPDDLSRHRTSGEIPRCGRASDRRQAGFARAFGRSFGAAGTI